MQEQQIETKRSWFDRYYKLMFIIPILIVMACLIYLGIFYSNNNDVIYKDISLSGGTTLTLRGELPANLESSLKPRFPDLIIRTLTDITTGNPVAIILETASSPEELKPAVEQILGYPLTEENSSIEFSGSSLSSGFYRQLITALIISFILMSIVIFVLFRTFIPSTAVIFAAFADIVIPLTILNLFGVKISAAGIAAFLMLVGYSVDTDILLTTRALKKKEGTLNQRIYGAFKTGIFMTITALAAVLPAFFLVTGLPDSFRQIFLILALGLGADIINTWFTNVGIIKLYCEKKGIK